MSEPSEAAALVMADVASEALDKGMKIDEDAAEKLQELREAAPSSEEEAPAEQVQQEEPEAPALPEFKPIDIEDEFGEDDEPAPSVEEEETTDEWTEEDPEVARLKRQLEFEKGLRVKSNIKRWAEEERHRYPLANFESIEATSRRSFRRQAAQSHNANFEHLEPHLKALEEAYNGLEAKALAEAEKKAAKAWGRPTVGAGAGEATLANDEIEDRIKEARLKGDLAKILGYKRIQRANAGGE